MSTLSSIRFPARARSTATLFLAACSCVTAVFAQDPTSAPKPQAPTAAAAAPVYVAMTTNMGTFYLELNAEKAPISVQNFVQYAKDGFYNGTLFHRVIKTFMIQGGGFTPDLKEKPTKTPIKNEWTNGLPNARGSISMARTSAPDSATSQFFINTVDNKFLDEPRGGAAYAVFGKVIKGIEVVDAIAAVSVQQSSISEAAPKTQVVIEKVEVLSGPPAADAPTLPPVAPTAAAPAAPASAAPAAPKAP